MTVYRLTEDLIFPDPAMAESEGLLAVGGDLSIQRLLLAYSMGIFPWYSEDQPILWWSPDPRLILIPDQLHVSKSLKRVIKSGKFQIRFDTSFQEVIKSCSSISRSRQDGTWITEEMIEAYCHLHSAGYAHSIEAFFQDELVGGLYGISLGKAFFGESMFSLKSDASKVTLVALAELLKTWNFSFIDCQVTTDHLKSLGAVEIPRDKFLEKLDSTTNRDAHCGSWSGFTKDNP